MTDFVKEATGIEMGGKYLGEAYSLLSQAKMKIELIKSRKELGSVMKAVLLKRAAEGLGEMWEKIKNEIGEEHFTTQVETESGRRVRVDKKAPEILPPEAGNIPSGGEEESREFQVGDRVRCGNPACSCGDVCNNAIKRFGYLEISNAYPSGELGVRLPGGLSPDPTTIQCLISDSRSWLQLVTEG